jgi:hypothetical protein
MSSPATFPHSADQYQVLYGIEYLDDAKKWQHVKADVDVVDVGPVRAYAYVLKKDRDDRFDSMCEDFPQAKFRKVTVHVISNSIPAEKETSRKSGKTKTKRRKAA